jgi:signal transduction histidine kinase
MKSCPEDKGFAFLCAPDGAILQVIRGELAPSVPLPPGATIMDLMEKASVSKTRLFLAALNERQAAFDWELTMVVAGQTAPMHFAGAEHDGKLLIVAARSSSGLAQLHDELMSINNELTNALRAALKELNRQNRQETLRDSRLYDDLSRLNNELANLQREMARKNAELGKLNEEKNRFLGMAAHDLRSPLGVILTYAEFLETEAAAVLNEEQREFVATIKDISEFMLRMVTDLLDVSAIEAGQLKLDRQPADLGPLILRNVTLNRVLASRKEIAVELAPIPALPPIPLDAGKIEQVLNNLLSNAVKFSHRGSTVQVRLSGADGFVTVAVRDEGQGLPAADLPKLFKPFSKTSIRSTGGEQSAGLGLAIVRRIIEGHGGRVWVESKMGMGSTFLFTLPVSAANSATAASPITTP